eukprot:1919100-Pyramimonas_sp.AAC.1
MAQQFKQLVQARDKIKADAAAQAAPPEPVAEEMPVDHDEDDDELEDDSWADADDVAAATAEQLVKLHGTPEALEELRNANLHLGLSVDQCRGL